MISSSEILLKRCQSALRCMSFALLSLTLLTGCATLNDMTTVEEVKPWQRGTLARDDMQLVNDTLQQSVDDHIYFSKEASTGGSSVQGGGCGCN